MASGFRRAGLTVLLGSVLGFGINLALTPVLSRLVDPATFGSFMSVAATAAVFVGVSTMRLEVLAQGGGGVDSGDALRLASLLLWVTAALLGLVLLVGWALGAWGPLWLLVAPLVALGSWQLVGSATLTSRARYRSLAVANFLQGASTGLLQTGLAAVSPTVGGLAAGALLGRLGWAPHLPRWPSWRQARCTWTALRRRAVPAGTSAAINSLAGQAQILLPAALYGSSAAGFFAMAVRLLPAPLAVVSQAASAAAVGEVGRALRTGEGDPAATIRRGMKDLTLVGLLPCSAALALGTWAVPWLLGERWQLSGSILAILAVGVFAQFVVAPFSQVLNLTGHSAWLLRWDVTRLLLLVAAFGVPAVLGYDVRLAAGASSVVLIVVYTWLGRLCLRAASSPSAS